MEFSTNPLERRLLISPIKIIKIGFPRIKKMKEITMGFHTRNRPTPETKMLRHTKNLLLRESRPIWLKKIQGLKLSKRKLFLGIQ